MRRISKADLEVAGLNNSDTQVDEISVEVENIGSAKARVSSDSLDVPASNIPEVNVDEVVSESISIDDRSSRLTYIGLDSVSQNISDAHVDHILIEVLAPTNQPEPPEIPEPPELSGWSKWGNVFSRAVHYDVIKPHRYRGVGESEKFVSYVKNSQIDMQTNGLQIEYLDYLITSSYLETTINIKLIQKYRFHINWITRSDI